MSTWEDRDENWKRKKRLNIYAKKVTTNKRFQTKQIDREKERDKETYIKNQTINHEFIRKSCGKRFY